jgi:hypothetical protein
MKPTLTKEASKELTAILQKQFKNSSMTFPDELIEDLGLTLLNLAVISLKRRLKINRQNDIEK